MHDCFQSSSLPCFVVLHITENLTCVQVVHSGLAEGVTGVPLFEHVLQSSYGVRFA